MKALIQLLQKQQEQIFELTGFEERPVLRPPVDSELLARLERWWVKRGDVLPASYRDFLLVCDGIENFSLSYSLFGARDILSDAYPGLWAEVLESGVGYDYVIDQPPVLIGYDQETLTRVFFDLSHERSQENEAIVLEGNPGDLARHESFKAFLEFRAQTNVLTITHLLEIQAGQGED